LQSFHLYELLMGHQFFFAIFGPKFQNFAYFKGIYVDVFFIQL